MELADFLTLIQLAAGLNIVFVAVEVSQGYTRILSDKVFNTKQLLDKAFKKLTSTISVNSTTLNNIHSTDVDGKSTNTKIEEVKREYEKLQKTIEEDTEKIKENTDMKCNFRCFSGLSLMTFLFCCTLIFLSPFNNPKLVCLITLFFLIYSCGGWFLDESPLYCKLKFVILEYVIGLSVSLGLWLLIRNWVDFTHFMQSADSAIIIVAALLPFVNFIAFFLKMIRRVTGIRKEIDEKQKSLEKEIERINTKFDKLLSLEQLKMEMTE